MHRLPLLKQCAQDFPKPSAASCTLITSGQVTLRDGTIIPLEERDKEIVREISEHLDLDEVESLTLLRLFISNEALSPAQASTPALLLDALTEFYFEERLFAIRILGAMFRGKDNPADPFHELCTRLVIDNFPDQQGYAQETLDALADRSKRALRTSAVTSDPRTTARWAKQNLKEQLCLLEVFFWSTVAHSPSGGLVAAFLKSSGDTNLGRLQKYEDLLLDDEAARLFSDMTVLFGITGVQLLKLDTVLEEVLDLELATKQRHGYLASVRDVEEIHGVVETLPSDPMFSPIILAWGCVISKIARVPSDDVPAEYQSFHAQLNPRPPQRGRAAFAEPRLGIADALVNQSLMLRVLPVLQHYLQSPIFSTSLAASLASTITEPNNEQYRYILKCTFSSYRLLLLISQITLLTHRPSDVAHRRGSSRVYREPRGTGICLDRSVRYRRNARGGKSLLGVLDPGREREHPEKKSAGSLCFAIPCRSIAAATFATCTQRRWRTRRVGQSGR